MIIYKNRFSSTVMIYLDFRLRFWTIDYRFRDIQFGRKWIFPYLPIFGPLILARISLPKFSLDMALLFGWKIRCFFVSHHVSNFCGKREKETAIE